MKVGSTIKKHLMTGISYMIPVVVAGGLCMALAKILGGALVGEAVDTIPYFINKIGSAAMSFVVPVLTAFIAYSIADRPGIAPGLALGYIANELKAGFIGGMVAAFLVGYLIVAIKKYLKVPKAMQGLMPILIIPFFSSLIVGLAMYLLLGAPIAAIQAAITNWMMSLTGGSKFTLGAIIGAMMGFDMGGPINKTASAFCNSMLAEGVFGPSAAKIVGGMTPPLGIALAVFLGGKKRYSVAEREAAKAAVPLGLCFITEGVLPFAASDPLRVIPACSIGSAVAGGLAMMWGVECTIPHGGIFALAAMQKPVMFILAMIIGALVTATIYYLLKLNAKPLNENAEEDASELDSLTIDF